MRVTVDQLDKHLEQKGLTPVYLICGEEPLQKLEAADKIRRATRQRNITERIILNIDKDFNWQQLTQAANNLSLFSDKKLLELRFNDQLPSAEGAKALVSVAETVWGEDIFIISCGKLDSKANQSAWVKAIDQTGIIIQVWPIDSTVLPKWIKQRAASEFHLQLSQEAAEFLADHVEGNLLAAKQELQVIQQLSSNSHVELEDLQAIISDNSRHNVFSLAEALVDGDSTRVLRILDNLKQEGIEPILVNWLFAREIRMLTRMSAHLSTGLSLDKVYSEYKIWDKRKPAILKYHNRQNPPSLNYALLKVGEIDRIIKGILPGDPWEQFIWIGLVICGKMNQKLL